MSVRHPGKFRAIVSAAVTVSDSVWPQCVSLVSHSMLFSSASKHFPTRDAVFHCGYI